MCLRTSRLGLLLLGKSVEAVLADNTLFFCLEGARESGFLFTDNDRSHSTLRPGKIKTIEMFECCSQFIKGFFTEGIIIFS